MARGFLVLVVDDEKLVRTTVGRMVRSLGFEVATAADGQEAADRLGQRDVDIVVSDINMPGMSGVELLRVVGRVDPDVPVILVTGKPSLESAMAAIEHGAFHYLPKPIEADALRRVLNRAARLRQMGQLKRAALAISGLPGGRDGDLDALEASLDRALDSLWMAYQPLVSAADGSVFGYEALMRSDEPSLPHPGAVLDAAERLHRLQDVGRVVRARATPAIAADESRGLLFINIHPYDLSDDDLLDADAPLSAVARRTVLEITERASLPNPEQVRDRVAQLRQMGFSIAVDDLGAGYAGLTSFVTLQPEFVKIDMSLVRGVDRDPVRRKLIRSMTEVARDMGILVVAEGIETLEEREAIRDLGCDLLQGFLLARPGPPFPDVSW